MIDVAWLHQGLADRFGRDAISARPSSAVGKLRLKLVRKAGCHGISSLRRTFFPMADMDGSTVLNKGELKSGLAEFGIEISPHCTNVLKKNFDHKKILNDVTKVKIKDDLCHVNLLWSSAPCQDFSRNGKRLGTKNARGNLYKFPCRYINHHLPDAFVMEQVASFKEDAKHKKAFDAQMRALKRSKRYVIEDVVLNTADFCIPQT